MTMTNTGEMASGAGEPAARVKAKASNLGLAWIETNYDGASWVKHITGTHTIGDVLWIETDLPDPCRRRVRPCARPARPTSSTTTARSPSSPSGPARVLAWRTGWTSATPADLAPTSSCPQGTRPPPGKGGGLARVWGLAPPPAPTGGVHPCLYFSTSWRS